MSSVTQSLKMARELKILHFNDVYNIEGSTQEPVGGASRFTSKVGFEGAGVMCSRCCSTSLEDRVSSYLTMAGALRACQVLYYMFEMLSKRRHLPSFDSCRDTHHVDQALPWCMCCQSNSLRGHMSLPDPLTNQQFWYRYATCLSCFSSPTLPLWHRPAVLQLILQMKSLAAASSNPPLVLFSGDCFNPSLMSTMTLGKITNQLC